MTYSSHLWKNLSLILGATLLLSGCSKDFKSAAPVHAEGEETSTSKPAPAPPLAPKPAPITHAGSKYYRLTWVADPSSTMVIAFDARNSVLSDAKVYYDTVDHGRNVAAYSLSKTIDAIKPFLNMNNAFARLTGLTPNTVYYFVIQDGLGVSPRFSFKTAPNDPSVRLSIVAGGDSRNNRTPRRAANLLVSKLRPHFVFFGGDMTDSGSEFQWREWFRDWQLTTGADGRMIPIIVARGNHEVSNSILQSFFDTNAEVYYALTFGGDLLRAYTLNSESGITGEQTTWLVNDLNANSNIAWKMAQYHRPMRPHVENKTTGATQYSSWAEPFYKFKMNLVIESDSHTVKSTWPIRPSPTSAEQEGFVRDDAGGTIYLGEGCWGAPLRPPSKSREWTRATGAFNHFNWIFVDQKKMEVRTIKVDNASSVGQISDQDLFKIPAGLDVWNPPNGALISITRP